MSECDERIPWVSSSIFFNKKVGKIPHIVETPPVRRSHKGALIQTECTLKVNLRFF